MPEQARPVPSVMFHDAHDWVRVSDLRPTGEVSFAANRDDGGRVVACVVKRTDFLAAISTLLGVTVTENELETQPGAPG